MSVLSRILPPPIYITMPCVGIDISDTSLKYISFAPTSREHGERTLETWGDITIPSGVVERGQVHDPKQLAAVLKECKEATGADFVNVSLPEERAYLFETEIKPDTPLKEIRGLLEFRLEENVPIPSSEVAFDYFILPTNSKKKKTEVVVAAYARETIEVYYDACIEAGLRPISFEVEAQAMARAVVPHDVVGTVMLVDFGKTRTGIGIVHQGTLMYTSTIDIGGDMLSQALRKVVGQDVSESELTKLKNTQGLLPSHESSDVRDALLSTVSVIKDELVTRMQYWHNRNGNETNRRISALIMCGGSANLRGLSEYLSDTITVPCRRANVWENSFSVEHTIPPIDQRHSLGYATAIGLALKRTV